MISCKTFQYRIYPTEAQIQRLAGWEGTARFLWNCALEQRLRGLDRPEGQQRFYTAFDQINELTDARAEIDWLADMPRNVANQVLVELDKAWQRCFKKLAKTPRFKRRGRDTMGMCEPHARVFRLEAGSLVFPKLGPLKMVQHRPLAGTPKTCTIRREVDQWFVCISCERDVPQPATSALPAVGIDRGVITLSADSDGHMEPNPGFGERMAPRLAKAQRSVARKQKGSRNQGKARKKVARLQRKVRRQREHKLHTLSHRYAKSHGVVVVEDLQIGNMTASAKGTRDEPGSKVPQKAGLNRRILDAGWGKLVGFLTYKLAAVGGRVEKVPAAYSSQTCAACGHVDAASRRTQAEFVCTKCGHQDHADINAAKVILSRRTGGDEVCGGDSVARPTKQKLRVARRGTARKVPGLQSPALQGGDGLQEGLQPDQQSRAFVRRNQIDQLRSLRFRHGREGLQQWRNDPHGLVGALLGLDKRVVKLRRLLVARARRRWRLLLARSVAHGGRAAGAGDCILLRLRFGLLEVVLRPLAGVVQGQKRRKLLSGE